MNRKTRTFGQPRIEQICRRVLHLWSRPVALQFMPWLPCLIYYLWIAWRASANAALSSAAFRAEAVLFIAAQSLLLFGIIALADGAICLAGWRRARMLWIWLAHLAFAALYLDSLLFRIMSLHLVQGLTILCQGGVSHIPLNWAHTGIPCESLRLYVLGAAVLVLTLGLYSYAIVRWWRPPAVGLRLGRALLGLGYLALVSAIASVGDDPSWVAGFADLRKAMPICFGPAARIPGTPLLIQGLRQPKVPPLGEISIEMAATDSARPDIILIVLESTRGDFITKEITPNLQQLRAECLPFLDTLASGNASHLSWYSLLTGRQGLYFGVEKRAPRHEGSAAIRLLRRAGYKVHVFCSSTLDYHDIDKIAFGDHLELCDSIVDAQKLGIRGSPQRDLQVIRSVLAAMDGPPGGRLFLLFLHSTHHDYDWPPDEPAPFAPYAERWNYSDFRLSRERLALVMNRYRNALHFQDRLVGEVFSKLKRQGRYEKVVLAVTGDHGEEFLEHGKLLHASNLYRPQTHVPLLLRFPPREALPIPLSARPPLASHVDIFPTILHYLGMHPTGCFDGESLFRKMDEQVVITAENADLDPVRFCIQSPCAKAFFQFESRTRPTVEQRTLYLTEVTDTNDVPSSIQDRSLAGRLIFQTNFGIAFKSLFTQGGLKQAK